jgi:hypothetical protein
MPVDRKVEKDVERLIEDRGAPKKGVPEQRLNQKAHGAQSDQGRARSDKHDTQEPFYEGAEESNQQRREES